MKVLYLIDRPNLYGSEQHLLRLIDLLKDEHELSVLTFNDGPLLPILQLRGIDVRLMHISWWSVKRIAELRHYLNQGTYDLIHAHQPKALFWGTIASKLAKIPSIITIHSLPSSNIQSYSNPIKKVVVGTFHYLVKGISEALATRVIYLSKFSFQYALFKKKTSIVPNWLDKLADETKIRQNFSKEPRLISVGSVTYNKGMDRMISALARLKDHRWTINIVGDYEESYKCFLEDQASAFGIADRITFSGHSNNLDELLSESDGFILLSRGETFGLVYIEAMNFGLPVISWNIPVAKEIIPEGNLILNNEEGILKAFDRFFNDQLAFKYISSTNRAFVAANFTAGNVKPKYIKLYAEVLSDYRN